MERDSEFGCGSLRGKDEDALEMCELSKMVLSPNSSVINHSHVQDNNSVMRL